MDGTSIDQATQQNARIFFRALAQLVDDLSRSVKSVVADTGKKEDVANKAETSGMQLRRGGDPNKNPQKLDKTVGQIYRINLESGEKVFLNLGKDGNELIIPRNFPNSKLPELIDQLREIALQQKTSGNITVDFKPEGQSNYQPLNLQVQPDINLENTLGSVLEETRKNYNGKSSYQEALKRALGNLDHLNKTILDYYKSGCERHQRAQNELQRKAVKVQDKIYELGKEVETFLKQFGDQVPQMVKISEKQGNLGLKNGLREIIFNARQTVEQCVKGLKDKAEAVKTCITTDALARELFTLAQKADDPEYPGRLRGTVYTLKTQGPGRFSLEASDTGKLLMEVRIPKIGKPPIIKTDMELAEMLALLFQAKQINEVLGERSIQEYLGSTTAHSISRVFGTLTPQETMPSTPAIANGFMDRPGWEPQPAVPVQAVQNDKELEIGG